MGSDCKLSCQTLCWMKIQQQQYSTCEFYPSAGEASELHVETCQSTSCPVLQKPSWTVQLPTGLLLVITTNKYLCLIILNYLAHLLLSRLSPIVEPSSQDTTTCLASYSTHIWPSELDLHFFRKHPCFKLSNVILFTSGVKNVRPLPSCYLPACSFLCGSY